MIFKQSTATKLRQAQDDLAAVEKVILDAQQDRLAKLLDAAPEEITRLDRAIDDRQRQAVIYRDRIVALEGRLAEEQVEEQKQTMLAAVDGPVRKAVEKRAKSAQRVEAALVELSAATAELKKDSESISLARAQGQLNELIVWDPDTDRLADLLRSLCPVNSLVVDFKTRREVLAREFIPRAISLAKRAARFADAEIGYGVRFLKELADAINGVKLEPEDSDEVIAEVNTANSDSTDTEEAA